MYLEILARLARTLICHDRRPESIKSLRLYRADRTDIERDPSEHYLRPPELEKNFLISPPGSPPVGWEQIREDPPNATPLAEDLIHALRKLEVDAQFRRTKVEGQKGLELLLAPEDSTDGISVYVEDCDIDEDGDEITIDIDDTGEGWAYGEFSRYRMPFVPTALPPPLSMS
jgi:calcipressin-2